mmetsp:Transcript_71849/g.191770  ORF Transcript_71849/g.191770 Transcript_71849/m.191770 type:complete len:213 (-) Transcript_71849:82-720(-)
MSASPPPQDPRGRTTTSSRGPSRSTRPTPGPRAPRTCPAATSAFARGRGRCRRTASSSRGSPTSSPGPTPGRPPVPVWARRRTRRWGPPASPALSGPAAGHNNASSRCPRRRGGLSALCRLFFEMNKCCSSPLGCHGDIRRRTCQGPVPCHARSTLVRRHGEGPRHAVVRNPPQSAPPHTVAVWRRLPRCGPCNVLQTRRCNQESWVPPMSN